MTDDLQFLVQNESNDLVAFDEVRRSELLGGIEELGSIQAAAAGIGMTVAMVSDAVANDPRLETDIEIAIGRYRATVLRRLSELAFEGSEKPIIGGKNKDTPVGTEIVPNDTAMKLLAQMHFSDELAIVTRARIKAEVQAGAKDELKADFSQLSRQERRDLERILKKAVKTVDGNPK